MKLVTLNTWGGNLFDPLMRFVEMNKEAVDIFAFQEVWSTPTSRMASEDTRANLLQELEARLPGHVAHFSITQEGVGHDGPVDFELATGNATFVRKDIPLIEQGETFIHGTRNSLDVEAYVRENYSTNPRLIQWCVIENGGVRTTLLNLHGLVNPQRTKEDNPERLRQARVIIESLDRFPGRKILSGDFNLLPDTQSIRVLEDYGLRNLIKEYGVTSTRTSHYPKPHRFADYTFVSNDVEVKDFRVLPDEVSDHAALYLEFT